MVPRTGGPRSRWASWFKSVLRVVEAAPGLDQLAPAVEIDVAGENPSLEEVRVIAYPTSDLGSAAVWWEQFLGVSAYLVTDTVAVFGVGHLDVVVAEQCDLPDGGLVCWGVDDVQSALNGALARGATPRIPWSVVGAGLEIAGVMTPEGAVVGFASRRRRVRSSRRTT